MSGKSAMTSRAIVRGRWMNFPELLEGQAYFLLAERLIILAALWTWQQFLNPVLGPGFPCKVIGEFVARQVFGFPLEVKHLAEWPEVLLRILVAIKAPAHAVGLRMMHDSHFPHVAMTTGATYPSVDVCRVIKIDIIRSPVYTHPLHRLAVVTLIILICSLTDRFEFRAAALHMLMTVPAG